MDGLLLGKGYPTFISHFLSVRDSHLNTHSFERCYARDREMDERIGMQGIYKRRDGTRKKRRGAFTTIDGEEVKAPIEHGYVILNPFVDRCQMRN